MAKKTELDTYLESEDFTVHKANAASMGAATRTVIGDQVVVIQPDGTYSIEALEV